MKIKIAIAEDHLLFIDGLLGTFKNHPHIEVTGAFTKGIDLLKHIAVHQPDILLLDMQLPDTTGNELAAKIRQLYPGIRIIILTGVETPFHVKDIIQMGCMGYLFKSNTSPDMLLDAIEKVYAGENYIDPAAKDALINNMFKKQQIQSTDVPPRLTQREKEILQLIGAQYSNQAIADKLFISQRTVENHRFNLLQKLGVKNTAGLLMKAVQLGLME